MQKAFTLIEILSAIFIMSIVMVVSMQSISYMNQIHQENELNYLALNRLDSEMSRLLMSYENHNRSDFIRDLNSISKNYKEITSDPIIDNQKFGLKITSNSDSDNFVQIKDIKGDINIIENGDFIGKLTWVEEDKSIDYVTFALTIEYPYIYYSDTNFPKLWKYTNKLTLRTSTKVKL